uniref:F-box domain-containing protein n=1 Tax=Caenorhabditis tropicalis TaxID=1561998 RepID=A0A1I7V3S5_9PELO
MARRTAFSATIAPQPPRKSARIQKKTGTVSKTAPTKALPTQSPLSATMSNENFPLTDLLKFPAEIMFMVLDRTSLSFIMKLVINCEEIKTTMVKFNYRLPLPQISIFNKETRIVSSFNETIIIVNEDEEQATNGERVIIENTPMIVEVLFASRKKSSSIANVSGSAMILTRSSPNFALPCLLIKN